MGIVVVETQNLIIESLETEKGQRQYREFFKDLGSENPYYFLELLISKEDNQELCCFYYRNEERQLALMPMLLRKIILNDSDTGYFDVSSPYGCNGPLFSADCDKQDMVEFWESVDNWYKDNNVITEFIRFNFDNNHIYYSGTVLHSLNCVQGDVTNWENFWNNLKSNTRNQFRKAIKQGLDFKHYSNDIPEEVIEVFYQLYIGTMDRRKADDSFYLDLSYFMNFCSNHPGKVAIGLVYKDDVPISGEFFLLSKDTMISYLAGTDATYFKFRPTEFLKISAVEWANKSGLRYYMIGGGRSDSDDLYLYKKKYFPKDEDVEFFTGRKVISHDMYLDLVTKTNTEAKIRSLKDGFFPQYREM